ncbi:uncharacterized protein TNCV_2313381 [Trichonephila clavipes]|nr:uncharacterized protein TNCV_2313381 [Trichonephila clavipes]
MEFLKNRKDFFKDLRLDTALNEMLCDAREFADEIYIPANFELTQPRHRIRRRNVNFDYDAREDPIDDPTLKYKTEFYFFTLDKAINALESRTILDRVLGARAAGVHYRLISVWTLVPVRLGKQLSDYSTVDEMASEAADCRHTYTMANCPQRR